MISIATYTGPVGMVTLGVTAYLDVGGERFSLETARTKGGAKTLIEKWQRYSQMLNTQFEVSSDAQKYAQ